MSSNRNPIKNWFITFPRSVGVTKQVFSDSLPPTTYKKIVQEEHKDGTPHLHAIVQLSHTKSKAKFIQWFEFKFPTDYHRIHISPIRSLNHTIDYTGKEDPNPLVIGDLVRPRRRARSIAQIRADFLMRYPNGRLPTEVVSAMMRELYPKKQEENPNES